MADPASPKHKVVVLGGGFAGLSAVRALKSADAEITLLDRRNFHLFQPLLYQVATGSLSPSEISSPLRSVFRGQKNVRVLMGEAAHIDAAAKSVSLTGGDRIEYDTLIVAVGSAPSYYGHQDWKASAPCLKSIEDATEMRRRIFTAFENAELDGRENSAWLTFVIVGGGATGVELAGALSEIARKTLKDDFRSIHPGDAQLILVDQAPRILPSFSDRLAAKAADSLQKLGVQIRCGVRVTAIDQDGVSLDLADGSAARISAKTVLWAGGVAVPDIIKELAASTNASLDQRGRIEVLPDLTLPGHPEIFIAGDTAAFQRPDGTLLPGVAQVALQQGRYAGSLVSARLRREPPPAPFRYSDRGDMAVIGRAAAVANLFGLEVWGWPAWIVWVFIHLMYLVEFQSRIVVLVRWAFQYFAFRRGARLITGPDSGDHT
jgi:NADH dehydrogenase